MKTAFCSCVNFSARRNGQVRSQNPFRPWTNILKRVRDSVLKRRATTESPDFSGVYAGYSCLTEKRPAISLTAEEFATGLIRISGMMSLLILKDMYVLFSL